MLRRSDFIAATYALVFVLANFGIAIAARMPMITTTIRSSISVKPLRMFFMVSSWEWRVGYVDCFADRVMRVRCAPGKSKRWTRQGSLCKSLHLQALENTTRSICGGFAHGFCE